MFEEICLVCGKHLQDDGAYCSDDCQSSDLASPSISSSSSALSSPQLGYAQGLADVPALMPHALGSALRKYQAREPYCVNPPASSSNPWTLGDDDDSGPYGRGSEYLDPIYEGSSKSANYIYSMMPSALSYARRPSGTNNHSIVPQVQQRNSSGSSPAPQKRAAARSAPNHSHSSTDEEDFSDYSLSSRDAVDDGHSDKDYPYGSQLSTTSSKRNRKRTSLPACFSLLQISTSTSAKEAVKTSPVSSSSARTIARISPPTPKHPQPEIAITNWQQPYPLTQRVQEPPRGRRRDDDRTSCHSGHSSPSRSRSRQVRRPESPRPIVHTRRGRPDSRESVEQVFDWDNAGLPRGRTSVRRNSSPPRMLMGVEDPTWVIAAIRDAERYERSKSKSNSRAGRGRVPVNELDGVDTLAPGYGHGRSGLMDRERLATLRVPL